MSKLILIKHAAPKKDAERPSHQWQLSDDGREAARRLAGRVCAYQPDRIITSREPKAVETGQIVADACAIPLEQADGLEEHHRRSVPLMRTRDFVSAVAHFFSDPQRRVLGEETADAARARITAAIDELVGRYGNQSLAVVTHGTVLSLYAAGFLGEPPFQLWRNLGLPSLLVFELPDMKLVNRPGPRGLRTQSASISSEAWISSSASSTSFSSNTPSSSSAMSAAFCSAVFLLGPHAERKRRPATITPISKHLL